MRRRALLDARRAVRTVGLLAAVTIVATGIADVTDAHAGTPGVGVARTSAPVTHLHAKATGTDAIALHWRAPRSAHVTIRMARGINPPKGPHAGTAVPVHGHSATASQLDAGTPYTFSVFTHATHGKVSTVTTAHARTIAVAADTGHLTGVVSGTDGAPVEGLRVHLYNAGDEVANVRTARDGSYAFAGPSGAYQLCIDGTSTRNMRYESGCLITDGDQGGDQSGDGSGGAQSALTAWDGSSDFVPGNAVMVGPGETTVQDVTISPLVGITGTVVDMTGHQLPGALVYAIPDPDLDAPNGIWMQTAQNATFSFGTQQLVAGENYLICAVFEHRASCYAGNGHSTPWTGIISDRPLEALPVTVEPGHIETITLPV